MSSSPLAMPWQLTGGTLLLVGSLRTKAGNPAYFIDVVEQCYRAEPRPERRELASVIDEYPLCKRLMEAYRRVYHMPNKTPLSILFEYASRLNLQVCPTLMIRQMCSGSSEVTLATH